MKFFRRDKLAVPESALFREVREAIGSVQAYARSHGGQIHLVNVTDGGEVQIRLTGACKGCPLSDITLKRGIEDQLKASVPGVTAVRQVL